MYLRYRFLSKKLCMCGVALQNLGFSCFSTWPVYLNAKYTRSWRHELPYSDTLFHYKLEVPVSGMLHLTTPCNTYVKSKYNEDEPMKKELDVKIYGRGDQGVKIEDLQNIVDRVHKFREIVKYKFTGHPPLLRVDFPHLQKYKHEIQNCLAIVVEMPYQYGMLADVKEWGNLCIQDFENEYTSGYTEYGYIEISKIKTDYADVFSGSDIFCNDYVIGSGQFVCLQEGDIYMKKLQGINFAMDGLVGNVETESVYCKDVVYTNELGNVTTGIVNADICHVETEVGKIEIDSLSTGDFVGKIYETGDMDVTLEKTSDLYIYHAQGGSTTLKVGPEVEFDLLVQSKTSSVSSELKFSQLEKYTDHIQKYDVTKGQIGNKRKQWKIENDFGHVRITEGDWMSNLRRRIPNFEP